MRLWLSVAVLLILTCVVLEISAAKSKRDTEATKDNSKSTDPKEVRFSKNKSDQNKKGKGKAEEVVKEKKRRSAEGSKNKDAKEVSKKNRKESDVKLPKEEQKRQKSNKQQKTSRNGESYKKEKTVVKVAEDTGKRQKRSIEPEQPKKTVNGDETGSSAQPEDSESNSASKKGGKSKSEKKSGIRKDGEKEANPEEVVASLSDIKTRSLKKDKYIKEEKKGGSKKAKTQKHAKKSEVNMKPKRSESKREKIQTPDQEGEELENIKYLEDIPENSYYLNGDGLIKEKKAGDNKNVKRHKSVRKSSKTDPACESEVNAKLRVPEQRTEAYESGSCNLEADCLPDENTENAERSKYFAYDSSQSSLADIKLVGVDNEAPKSDVDQELTEES